MKSIRDKFGSLERPSTVLSFVGSDGDMWAPERTGNYADDCELGRFYARELLAFISIGGCYPLLGYVCKAIDGVSWSGVEVGFFQQISEAAAGRVCIPVS